MKAMKEVWIHQDAWFYLGTFDRGFKTDHSVKKLGNGVYTFLIKGEARIDGNDLNERDGIGIWNTDKFSVASNSQGAEILLMEVPMRY